MFVISLQSLQINQLFAIKTIKKNKYFRQIKLRVGTGNVSKRHQPNQRVENNQRPCTNGSSTKQESIT